MKLIIPGRGHSCKNKHEQTIKGWREIDLSNVMEG